MLLTKLRNFKTNIKPTWIYAFVFSVIFGGVAHLYKMVNWLPNWDSLVFRKDPQHMESLGRWFLSFASKLSTDYEVPWLNGLLAIAFISVSAVLICETFDIKSKISAALIGAVTVTFPTVISTFTYTYVVDSYALSFLFVCIAVYLLTHKGKISAAAAVLLLTLSLGIYQAYITTAIALLTASLLTELLTSKDKAKTLTSLKKALKYIVCGIIAFLLYYVIQLAVTAFSNIEISNNEAGTNQEKYDEMFEFATKLSSIRRVVTDYNRLDEAFDTIMFFTKSYDFYFASPFFNDEQIERETRLICHLRDMGYSVFSPRENCYLPPTSSQEEREKVFKDNCDAIRQSKAVFAITDGKDIGTIWEAGFACGIKVPVVYYAETLGNNQFNLMLAQSGVDVFTSQDEVTKESLSSALKGQVRKYRGDIE